MNTQEVKGDTLFLMLDACRFDTFLNADTPNFRKVGGVSKAYSPSCWTISTLPSYLYGVVPLGYIKEEYGLRRGRFGFERYVKKEQDDYWYGFYSPNPTVDELKPLMKKFHVIRTIKYSLEEPTCRKIFDDIRKDILDFKERNYFIFTLFMETHPPIWNGKEFIDDPSKQFESQIKAVEYIDKEFGRFLDKIELRKPTKIIITSDHGELMGERNEKGQQMYGHDPRNNYITFHPKLFEIPYIEGIYA